MTDFTTPKPIPIKRNILEKDVKKRLRAKVKAVGGEYYNWKSKNVAGVYDCICVFHGNRVWFVELKKPIGGVISGPQERFAERMDELGVVNHCIIKNYDEVDTFIQARKSEYVLPL